MHIFATVTVVGLVFLLSCNASLTKSLFHADQQRITQILQQGAKNDLESIFYSVTGLKALGKTHSTQGYCDSARDKVIQDNAQSIFQYSEIVKVLKCKNAPPLALSGLVKDGLDSLATSQVIIAMVNLGQKVDDALVKQFVKNVKDNDTPVSASAAFHAASLLPKSADLKPVVSMVEDIIAQADLVGGNTLQFEGGLAVTSSVVKNVMLLGEKEGSMFINQNQMTQFAHYFVNRKYVHHLKDIHYLLTVLAVLSNNKLQVPVVVSAFKTQHLSHDNKVLKVRVTNLLDQTIPDVKVTAKSFSTSDDSVVLFENKQFSKTKGDDDNIIIEEEIGRGYIAAHSFSLDVMSFKPSRGLYKCKVSFQLPKGQSQYSFTGSFELDIKVLAKIVVEDVEVAVGEKDRELAKSSSVTYPNKLASVIEADYHQKIVMTFNLKDLFSKDLVTAHQTFIRLVHQETGQEIFFVAEPDSSDHYKFTLDVGATAKDSFNNLAGKYQMSLIVGDATMQVPINWAIGDVTLVFSDAPKKTKRQERITEPRPVIEHMFRVPEKRPSKVVSTAFTFLVLSPLLVMLAMWANVGVNLSNFSFSLSTVLFHVGLAGIFALYYMFWTQLDMFQTLKLLAVVGGLTFLGGNKMLADMAAIKYRS